MSLLFITHDLGIVRRIADVVCVNEWADRRAGTGRAGFHRRRSIPTPRRCLAAGAGKPDPAPPASGSPVVMSADGLKGSGFQSSAAVALHGGHIKAVDGVTASVRKGETLGVVGESGSGKPRRGWRLFALDFLRRAGSCFLGPDIQGLRLQGDAAPFRRDMADRIPGFRSAPLLSAHVGRATSFARAERASALIVAEEREDAA